MKKIAAFAILIWSIAVLAAQDPLVSGLDAYARSDWPTAILAFRKAALNSPSSPDPWYWLALSEMSAKEYEVALKSMASFESSFPRDSRIPEILYQKSRVYYLIGWYEQAINGFYQFIKEWPSHQLVSSSWYWAGECLYSVGRTSEARAIFYILLSKYPEAVKREAAFYRVSLIDQGSREEELLKLLKTSHEESLKIIEDYQRRERTFEQALTAYQKRISELGQGTDSRAFELLMAEEKARYAELERKYAQLETENAELLNMLSLNYTTDTVPRADTTDPDARKRILEQLRLKAQSLQNAIDESGAEVSQ